MKIELRPARHQWAWIVREGNVANLSGKRFRSPDETLRDARSRYEESSDGDDPPPLVA
jgi:hypothetical protein